jgi:hypothetical protein
VGVLRGGELLGRRVSGVDGARLRMKSAPDWRLHGACHDLQMTERKQNGRALP